MNLAGRVVRILTLAALASLANEASAQLDTIHHLPPDWAGPSAVVPAPWTADTAPEWTTHPRPDLRDGAFDSVVVSSGEFRWSETDLSIPGRGIDFLLERTYRSRSDHRGTLGVGWTHSYEACVDWAGNDLLLRDGTGRASLFRRNSDDTFTAPGWFAVLRFRQDDTIEVQHSFGHYWVFHGLTNGVAEAGKLKEIVDPFLNRMTFEYNPAGHLATVVDTMGRQVQFEYDGLDRLESVTDWAGRTVRYEHYSDNDSDGGEGDLRSATSPAVVGTPNGNDFPHGKTRVYTYFKNAGPGLDHNLRTVGNPDGSVLLTNWYGGASPRDPDPDRVSAQQQASAADIDLFRYTIQDDASSTCTVNDEIGNVREYQFWQARRTAEVREFTGRADPSRPTTATDNRPTNPLRPGEDVFLTRLRWNEDLMVIERQRSSGGIVDGETFTITVASQFERAIHAGNLLERSWGSGAQGAPRLVETFTYHPTLGLRTSWTKPGGETTEWERDPTNGAVLKIRHPDPAVVEEFEYNAFGQRTAHIFAPNALGERRRDEFVYSATTGYLIALQANAAHSPKTTIYDYDLVGNVVSETDPRGHTTTAHVNALGQTVQLSLREVDQGGKPVPTLIDFYYDENDRLIQRDIENRDETGALQSNTHWSTWMDYDDRGRLVCRTVETNDGANAISKIDYLGDRTVLRRPGAFEGRSDHTETYVWDERRLLFQLIRAAGTSDQSTTQWDYDHREAVIYRTEGLESGARGTQFVYDDYGRPEETHDSMGNIWTFEHDNNGLPIGGQLHGEIEDLPGSNMNTLLWDWTLARNAMGQPQQLDIRHFDIATQRDLGDGHRTTTFEYAPDGMLHRRIDDDGGVWTTLAILSEDSLLRIDPMGQSEELFLDPNGNLVQYVETRIHQGSASTEQYTTLFDYDERDRLAHRTDQVGNVWSTEYDSRGHALVRLSPTGARTEYSFDGRGLLLEERTDRDANGLTTDPGDSVVFYNYDADGRRIMQTDSNGNATLFAYDALDRLLRTVRADGTEESTSYDAHGDPVEQIDANGSVLTQKFDALSRLIEKAIAPGAGVSSDTLFETYVYDGLGRLTGASDDDSQLSLEYSSLGDVLRETLNGQRTSSTYNDLGHLMSSTYPSGRQLSYDHDLLGRTTTVREGATVLSTMLYAGHQVVRRDLVNGVNEVREYNGIGNDPGDFGVQQLKRATWNSPGQAEIDFIEIAGGGDGYPHHYFDGKFLTAHDLVREQGYIHQWDRTLNGKTETVEYHLDGENNRIEVVGGPDAGPYFMDPTMPEPADFQRNQYTSTPFDERTYDGIGDLLDVANGESSSATYDYRGRIVVWRTDGIEHHYAYDPLDRMIRRVHDVDGAADAVDIRYRLHQMIEEEGATLATYAYEGESEHAFQRTERSGAHYYLRGLDGTVEVLVDETATVLEHYDYDPFGVPTVRKPDGTVLPSTEHDYTFTFQGRIVHLEMGHHGKYRSGAAFYDPRTGRQINPRASSDVLLVINQLNSQSSSQNAGTGGSDRITIIWPDNTSERSDPEWRYTPVRRYLPLPTNSAENGRRFDPYKNFKFRVHWDGATAASHAKPEWKYVPVRRTALVAGNSSSTTRIDPYKNFKFRVRWDSTPAASTNGIQVGLMDGSVRMTTDVRKMPGMHKFSNITLKRGVISSSVASGGGYGLLMFDTTSSQASRSDEPGLPGVTIYSDLNGNDVLD